MNDFLEDKNLVHKYYSPSEYSLDALINHYFWFSKREFLNDPFDLGNFKKGRMNLTHQLFISTLLNGLAIQDDIMSSLLLKLPNYASCSFTKSPLNKQMWAYYAKDYSGWCLSFNADGELKVPYTAPLLPAVYVDNSLNPIKPVNKNLYGTSSFDQALYQVLCTKHESWQHEDEMRMILHAKSNKNGVARDWNSFHLRAITIGNRISEPYRNILTTYAKCTKTPLLEIELSNRDFELQAKKIL